MSSEENEAHEAMRALAGAVCPKCGRGFDEVTKFTDPEATSLDAVSLTSGGFRLGGRAKLLITVYPCHCRITGAEYAALKRKIQGN